MLHQKPKTVRVTIDIVNEDGSTTIVKTTDLTAESVSRHNSEEEASHLIVGVGDPYFDGNYFDRWMSTYSASASFYASYDHFQLNIQLPKASTSEDNFLYTVQHIEKPTNRMVLVWDDFIQKIRMVELDEEEVVEAADTFPTCVYFFVDIP